MKLLKLCPRGLFDVCSCALWRTASAKERRRMMRRKAPSKRLETLKLALQPLEGRVLLYGNCRLCRNDYALAA